MAFWNKSQSIGASLEVYLTKWLKEATLENVSFAYETDNSGVVYFNCKKCGLSFNWQMAAFAGGQIPFALQEWVNQHRHGLSDKEKANFQALKNIEDIKKLQAYKMAQAQANVAGDIYPPSAAAQSQNFWGGLSGIAPGIKSGASQISPEVYKQLQEKYELDQIKYGIQQKALQAVKQDWWKPAPPPQPEKPKVIPPLPEVRGRKFRNIEKTDD